MFIDIKKEKLKRVAEIKSKVLLKNYTCLPLQFIIMDSQGVLQQESLKTRDSIMPVPFNNLDRTLMMSMKSSMSNKLSIKDAIQKHSGLIKLPLVCAKESFNNLNLDVSTSDGIVTMIAKPALKILNYCPVPIEYILKYRETQESNIIFRNKPMEIYRFDPYTDKSTLSLILNDIYETDIDMRKFLASKNNYRETIMLVQEADKEMKIYLEIINAKDQGAVIIFSRFNIYNETGFSLDMLSFKHRTGSSYRPAVACGNRDIVFLASKAHDSIMVKPNKKTLHNQPGVGDLDNKSYCVVPKMNNCSLNQTLRGGSDKGKYELCLVFNPEVIEVADSILTKALTIAPKYVLVNNTKHKMNFIQKQCNYMFQIEAKSRQAIIWRSEYRECSFQLEDPRNL